VVTEDGHEDDLAAAAIPTVFPVLSVVNDSSLDDCAAAAADGQFSSDAVGNSSLGGELVTPDMNVVESALAEESVVDDLQQLLQQHGKQQQQQPRRDVVADDADALEQLHVCPRHPPAPSAADVARRLCSKPIALRQLRSLRAYARCLRLGGEEEEQRRRRQQ
jgi:hypothetical protein